MPGEDGEEGPEPENSLRVGKGSHLGSEGSTVHRLVQSNTPTDVPPSFPPFHGTQQVRAGETMSTPLGSELSSLNLLLTWLPASLFLPLLPVPSPRF